MLHRAAPPWCSTLRASATSARAMKLASSIRIYRVNGVNPRRVANIFLRDAAHIYKQLVEIALVVQVQQLMSGIFVTRLAVMCVYPMDAGSY